MQAVTPFSYIDYFLHKFNGGSPPRKSSVSQSIELILSMIRGIFIYTSCWSLAESTDLSSCIAECVVVLNWMQGLSS